MTDARWFDGGRIFTGRRYVEALLVEDDRVVAAGSRAEVAAVRPTGAEHVPLGGHLIVPGLIDLHLHLSEVVRTRGGIPLADLRSHADLLQRLREAARERPDGLLVGRGIAPEGFVDRTRLDRRDLDPIVPDRPLVLFHASGHTAVVNGAALDQLAEAGVGLAEQDELLPDGRPSGILVEESVRRVAPLVARAVPVRAESMEALLRETASLGLTTVAAMNSHPDELSLLEQMGGDGRLPIRIRAYGSLAAPSLPPPTPPDAPGSDRFRIVGVKTFADGAFGPRTAALSSPYDDAPGTSGVEVGDEPAVVERLREANRVGLAVAVHAIGDRAVVRAARWIGQLGASPGPRHRIEHASLAPPEVWSALDAARPALVVQPGFVWSDGWLAARLGAGRARWAYPFRSLVDHGHLLASSSDAPYDPIDPWRSLRATVERRDPQGRSANPEVAEALPAEGAFLLATAHGGQVLGEDGLGTLEPGAPADFVEVDGPDAARAIRAGSAGVVATWSGGVEVFRRPPR